MSQDVKYPDIEVQLTVVNGNTYAIIGVVERALRKAGVSNDERKQFVREATSGDYDNVLQTAMLWVNVH